MRNSLYCIFPEFVHRNYIFRILVTDGQKIPKFSGYCFPVFQFVCNLDIYLLTLFFSDKIDLTIVRFANIHAVTSSFQLQKNNILQYPADHTVVVAHGCVNDGYIAYIKLLLRFQDLFSFDVVTGNTVKDKCSFQSIQVIVDCIEVDHPLLTFEIIRYILSGEGISDIVEGILDHSFQ